MIDGRWFLVAMLALAAVLGLAPLLVDWTTTEPYAAWRVSVVLLVLFVLGLLVLWLVLMAIESGERR